MISPKKLTLSLLALVSMAASSQLYSIQYEKEIVEIWGDGDIPFNKSTITVEETIDDQNKRFSKVSKPVMFVYRRTDVSKPGPGVLVCPGGGYKVISIGKSRGEGDAKKFFKMGFHTVGVLKYRLPDPEIVEVPHKAPLSDAQMALATLHRNAAAWNLDRDRIGVKGASAGGHLVASLNNLTDEILAPGVKPDELKQAFSILRVPVITFKEPLLHKGSKRNLLRSKQSDASFIEAYSMENRVSANTPPTFVLTTTDDKSVPFENSKMYAERLADNGVPHKYVELTKGGHGFGFSSRKNDRDWMKDLKAWLGSVIEL